MTVVSSAIVQLDASSFQINYRYFDPKQINQFTFYFLLFRMGRKHLPWIYLFEAKYIIWSGTHYLVYCCCLIPHSCINNWSTIIPCPYAFSSAKLPIGQSVLPKVRYTNTTALKHPIAAFEESGKQQIVCLFMMMDKTLH